MHYVCYAQNSTSVTHALKTDYLEKDVRCLVVAKHNRIEAHALRTNGLELVCELPIWGTVEAMSSLHIPGLDTSTLCILTSSFDFFILLHDPCNVNHPKTVVKLCLATAQPNMTPSESPCIVISPQQSLIAIHSHIGYVSVISVSDIQQYESIKSNGNQKDTKLPTWMVNIPQLRILALTLIPLDPPVDRKSTGDNDRASLNEETTMVLLHENHDGQREIVCYQVDYKGRKLSSATVSPDLHSSFKCDDPGANTLIYALGGLIVIGEQCATWISLRKPIRKAKGKGTKPSQAIDNISEPKASLPLGQVDAVCKIEDAEDTFLLGHASGNLYKLTLIRDIDGLVINLTADSLHRISAPTSLVYLENEFVFVASHLGDSQLVRLRPTAELDMTMENLSNSGLALSTTLDVVTSWTNLAPIVDFCVVDSPTLAQSHLITCSGAGKDGSLRIVRYGAGFRELGTFDVEDVQRMWSLKLGTSGASYLVLGFIDSTRLLEFAGNDQDGSVEEIDTLDGWNLDTQTLAAGTLSGHAVQVTATGIGGQGNLQWCGGPITVAVISPEFIIIALEGGDVRKIELDMGTLKESQRITLDNDVACLDFNRQTGLIVAGLWTSHQVVALDSQQLSVAFTLDTGSLYPVHSVLIHCFADGTSHLFVGLGDGSLLSYVLDSSSHTVLSGTRTSLTLGTRPLTLMAFTSESGFPALLVNSDRPTAVTRRYGRLAVAAVNLAFVKTATCFEGSAFPGALVMATETGVRFGMIDEVEKIHVKTLPLEGEQPRRIVRSEKLGAIGILCLREEQAQEGSVQQYSSFKIIDEATLRVVFDFKFRPGEVGLSIIVAPLGVNKLDHFVIGTATVSDDCEAKSGRVLAFGSDLSSPAARHGLAYSGFVPGAVYSIVTLPEERLAVAANAMVIPLETTHNSRLFVSGRSWGGAFLSASLASVDHRIVVGDALRSIVILEFDPRTKALTEIGRHYRHFGTRHVSILSSNSRRNALHNNADSDYTTEESDSHDGLSGASENKVVDDRSDEEEYLCVGHDLNLYTVGYSPKARYVLEELQNFTGGLQARGHFHLGDQINRILPGSLVPKYIGEHAPGKPEMIFTTSTGAVGVLVNIDDSVGKQLAALERNMRELTSGIGSLNNGDCRKPQQPFIHTSPIGFIDGTFVESILDMNEDQVEAIWKGPSVAERIEVNQADIFKILEELRRLH